MAKTTKWATGIFLSVLVLAATTPSHAASPAPNTPESTAKAASGAKSPGMKADPEPRPRPEPQVVRRPARATTQKPGTADLKAPLHSPPRPAARPSASRRTYAQTKQDYRFENRQEWKAFDEWRATAHREYRPQSGPVYGAAPGEMAAAGTTACDDACQYREWFERYSAWYDRYGRSYDAARDVVTAPANPPTEAAHGHDQPRRFYAGDRRPDQSARDRLDPWHGYNSHDGLENGY